MADLNDSHRFVENFSIGLNITIQQNEYVTYITSDPGLIALFVVLVVMLETLGNFLLICMIFYEKYGMDPQKRTITNQLLSRMLIAQIFCNIFIMPIFTILPIFGLLTSK